MLKDNECEGREYRSPFAILFKICLRKGIRSGKIPGSI